MKDMLEEADAAADEKRARFERLQDEEKRRIAELQDSAREERERVASDTINNAEMRRRLCKKTSKFYRAGLQTRSIRCI